MALEYFPVSEGWSQHHVQTHMVHQSLIDVVYEENKARE